MRVYLTFSRIALVLTGLWIAMGIPLGVYATELSSESPQVAIAEPSVPANLLNYTEYYETADAKDSAKKEAAPAAAPAVEVKCGEGCSACSCDPGCPRWLLGIETVWLSPQMQRRALADYTIANTRTTFEDNNGSLASGLFITPRITLGYQGDEWGIQTRYWRMSESSKLIQPGIGTDIYNTTFSSGFFKAETIDLEATRMFCWRDTTIQLSFGVRYAQLDQSTLASSTRVVGGGIYTGSAFARNEFGGAGLTVGLAGYKPLSERCFKLFYNVRGSMVWDSNALSQVETQSSIMTLAGAAGADNGAIAQSNGSMFIGELQLGTQWDFELVKNRSNAFVRLALEYQYWNTQDAGGARAFSDAFIVGGATGHAVATAGDTRTDLVGFTVATGFTW